MSARNDSTSTTATAVGRLLIAALVLLASSGVLSVALAAAADDFPTDANSAIKRFETDVELDDWLDGPVEYIITNEERKAWKDAKTDPARRAFIDWFWARRDIDSRDGENPYRAEFYQRVADVNQRFRGFPRGWKSDRGRIWIVFGRPGGIRRESLTRYGRCSAPEGAVWTYFTQNLPFTGSMGEFFVVFVEIRVGEFVICDPSMGGPGAYPTYLRQALEIMQETLVVDRTLELGEDPTTRPSDFIAEAMDSELPAMIAVETEGGGGIAGVALFPVDIAIRDLLFRPRDERLEAAVRAEVFMDPGDDGAEPVSWGRQWGLSLTERALTELGGLTLRSAIPVEAPDGSYSVRVRIADTTSGAAATWDGEVSVRGDGSAVGPLLVGNATVSFGADDPVLALVGRAEPTVATGEVVTLLAWVRGAVPASDEITLRLTEADGEAYDLPVDSVQIIEGAAAALVITTRVENVLAGRYSIELDAGVGTASSAVNVR